MPRQRMVKPEFFSSDSLAECSHSARLAFIGLWVMADDNGNAKLSVRKLNRQIFPQDDVPDSAFAGMLAELEEQGCIRVYQVNGEKYINVPNFDIYQTVNHPSKSANPKPPANLGKRTRHFAESLGKARSGDMNHVALRESYGSPTGALTLNNESIKEGETTPKVVVSPSIQVDTDGEPVSFEENEAMCQRMLEVLRR